MGRVFGCVVSTVSLVVAVALSPYVVEGVDAFVNRFPESASWLRPVAWVTVVASVFGLCLLVSFGWARAASLLRFWGTRVRRRKQIVKHNQFMQLVAQFVRAAARLRKELSQEKVFDGRTLAHHVQTDEKCRRLLEYICRGPSISLLAMQDGYEIEGELADITAQHYDVEVREELVPAGSRTEEEKIKAARFGARCVDMLASRFQRGLAEKREALSQGGLRKEYR
jgi:hypothetical protein